MKIMTILTIALTWAFDAYADPIIVELPTPAVSESGVLVQNIGLETADGVVTPIVKKGCKVPCLATQILSTSDDHQSEITVHLFRGNANLIKENKFLGKYSVVGIPVQSHTGAKIAITVTVFRGGILLEAFDKRLHIPLTVASIR